MNPDQPIQSSTPMQLGDMPGRRLRALARMVAHRSFEHKVYASASEAGWTSFDIMDCTEPPSYLLLLERLEHDPALTVARERLGEIPLRMRDYPTKTIDELPEGTGTSTANASLHQSLMDLANAIIDDVVAACEAIDNPDLWYPGVDEGIEPVTDEHVRLVMWGVNRELYREAGRLGKPAPVLCELPFRIQRALAERRRLRYQTWGIGRKEYETNVWSLWGVPGDSDWVPARIYGDA
jgi:hypothetical protein